MVNNSTNINKTKESLNSDGQQFLQYQQTKRKLNSDGQQFYQYQQTKRKFEQWWSTIPPISTNQKKVLTVMVDNSTNINKPKESFNSDGQQFYQYQQNKRKF
jgi:GTP-sensing pleiotropic transcriptional regulator CodY